MSLYPIDLWKILGAAITAAAMLLGAGRYVGTLEQRIESLERYQRYMHGSFTLPEGDR